LGHTRYSKIVIVSAHIHSPERRASERKTTQVKTVLLVEDSDIERKVIRLAIESFTSFRVCEATNGIEGIKIAKEVKPDLIVLDLAMPQMNGLEAAMVLKNTMPTVPIVVLTLYADGVTVRSAAFGVSKVLSKTDGLGPLLDCLRKMLASRTAQTKD
jgi:CheY-like chemotaxis protein